ncbi:MAG TPA: chemotaxis protein CheW [Myxococcaceae bacterium]|nr:chemotaxis protein CheW [Myxococcaceae bacterium]
MSTSAAGPVAQYLSFFIAGEECALGILQVREIIEYDTVTRVPGAPPWVRGVTNLRGSVLPVIDLALKLGLPQSAAHRRSCIVVAEVSFQSEKLVLGVLADAIGQVVELGPNEVEPPPAFGSPVRMDYLVGMGRAGKKFILLLDMDRLLSGQELVAAGVATSPAKEAAP